MTAGEIENKVIDLYFFMLEMNVNKIVVPIRGKRKIVCLMENEHIVIKSETQESGDGNN